MTASSQLVHLNGYSGNQHLAWNVHLDNSFGERSLYELTFSFTQFDLEEHSSCDYDWMRIAGGTCAGNRGLMLDKQCGEDNEMHGAGQAYKSLPWSLASGVQDAVVEFQSDGYTAGSGFQVLVSATERAQYSLCIRDSSPSQRGYKFSSRETYIKVSSGTCVGNGMLPVTTVEECNIAARYINPADTRSVEEGDWTPRPEGCYDSDNADSIWFASQVANIDNGYADDTRKPLCKSSTSFTISCADGFVGQATPSSVSCIGKTAWPELTGCRFPCPSLTVANSDTNSFSTEVPATVDNTPVTKLVRCTDGYKASGSQSFTATCSMTADNAAWSNVEACVDVDECLSSPCAAPELCVNTVGSYFCRVPCPSLSVGNSDTNNFDVLVDANTPSVDKLVRCTDGYEVVASGRQNFTATCSMTADNAAWSNVEACDPCVGCITTAFDSASRSQLGVALLLVPFFC
jgi:hypothetical protein